MALIAIDARQYTTSTGRYVYRLAQYLEKLDTANDYIVLLKPEDMSAYEFTNPRFTKVPCPHKEFTFDEQLGLLNQLNGLKADLVHFCLVQQPVLYRGRIVTTVHDLTTARFANPAKNPVVFSIKQQVYKWVIKRAIAKSKIVLVPSQYVKDDLVAFSSVNPTKIVVTYEAADPIDMPAEELDGLKGKRFLMYVGRPTPHKNLERLIEAHQQLRADYPNLMLVLAGKKDANYRRIETSVLGRKLPGIIFTDFISDAQLRWLYENCAAYVFPSLSEGFGLPGLEAMVHGAPVVSSNATCLPEIYGDAAHYFDPNDVQAITKSIADVLSNEVLRKELVVKGIAQAKKYSWQRMAEQTLEVYKKALGN